MAGRGYLILGAGLVAGLLIATAWERWLQEAGQRPADRSVASLELVGDCDPVGSACIAQGQGLRVGIQFSGPIEPLRPFQVSLFASGAPVQGVALAFEMPGMDMGRNRYRLLAEGERWQGTVTLPVCTTGRRDWLAQVEVEGAERIWRFSVPFTAGP